MFNFIVEAKSRQDLRMIAYSLRAQLKLENRLFFPVVEMLDVFTEIFSPQGVRTKSWTKNDRLGG